MVQVHGHMMDGDDIVGIVVRRNGVVDGRRVISSVVWLIWMKRSLVLH